MIFNFLKYVSPTWYFNLKPQIDHNYFPNSEYVRPAVKDSISHILAPKRGLDKYFNAGVMWLNLPLWREENAVEKLLIHQPKIRRFAEQELLNEVIDNRWFELPLKYNFAANRLRLGNKMPDRISPIVIYYAGPIIPLIYWVNGSRFYWRNSQQTGLKKIMCRCTKP